jgi:DNA mismatch repair protein MutL
LLPPDSPRTASLPSGANPPDDRRDDRPPTPASEFAIPATMPPPDPWPDWSPALEPPARASARPPAQVYAAIPARRDAEALGDLDAEPGRTLWQLHGRYLLSPVRSGLLIIDQQAAHERILYERALASMDSGMAPRQQLLFPFTVRLAPADRALFDEILPDLAALGFDLSLAKDGTVLVRGLPADVTLGDERAVLDDLLAQYRRNASLLRLDARDNLARSLARRSAIRPGHTLRAPEARGLVDQLFACTDPFTDPSGRPTLVRLSEDEIERRFKR